MSLGNVPQPTLPVTEFARGTQTYSPSHMESYRPGAYRTLTVTLSLNLHSLSHRLPGQAPQLIFSITLSPVWQVHQSNLLLSLSSLGRAPQPTLPHTLSPVSQAPERTLLLTEFPGSGAPTYSPSHSLPGRVPQPALSLTPTPPGHAPQPTILEV